MATAVRGEAVLAAPAPGRIGLLAESGAHVSHYPLALARRGWCLHSFDRYRRAGINIGIGTDTCPRDIVDEMRWASYVCKLVEGDFSAGQPADVITAAKLCGARTRRPWASRSGRARRHCRLPLKSAADGSGFRSDPESCALCRRQSGGPRLGGLPARGRRRKVVGLDEERLMSRVQAMVERHWSDVPEWEGSGRTAEEICPSPFTSLKPD